MENVYVKNLSLKIGRKLIVGVIINPDAKRFNLNIGPNDSDIALHIDVRFDYGSDKDTVVLNSFQDGSWGPEQKESRFPFQQGGRAEISVELKAGKFHITLPDSYTLTYPNRMGYEEYSVLSVKEDARTTNIVLEL